MNDSYKDCIALAKAELKQARSILQNEIRRYPTPIAGCDVQFNHLIAERQKVLEALERLESTFFVPTPRTPFAEAGVESR